MVEFFTSYFIFGCVLILCGKPIFAIPPFIGHCAETSFVDHFGRRRWNRPGNCRARLARTLRDAIPIVIGDPHWVERGISTGAICRVVQVMSPSRRSTPSNRPDSLHSLNPAIALGNPTGEGLRPAGQAAYDFLCDTIDRTLAKQADAIVTAPLHKEGLRAAGLNYPGHTEILAERTGTKTYAMVLFGDGLAVAHVTLHMALRDVFSQLSTDAVLEKIQLLADLLPRLLDRPARIAAAALNPHAGDGGLFGNEEATIIAPAVVKAKAMGVNAVGPLPADTLFVRAHKGEFDGIVAMYHDAGHIAMKLRSGRRCVNISAGLPIIRTSVAHGTAYDIAGKGMRGCE